MGEWEWKNGGMGVEEWGMGVEEWGNGSGRMGNENVKWEGIELENAKWE